MKHRPTNTHWIEIVKKSGPVGELNPGLLDVRSRTLPLSHTGSQRSKGYPWDRCDPVWLSGKVLDRTSRGPGFNSPTGPDFFTISIQCVFVGRCFIVNLINYFTGLYHLLWSSHALFGVSHCLRLAKVKLIGHPQIFLIFFFFLATFDFHRVCGSARFEEKGAVSSLRCGPFSV